MRRELWAIGCNFGYAVRVLNSIFCTDCNDEPEISEDDKSLVAEQINSMCSDMMIEDADDIIHMVSQRPSGRLCERTDCKFYQEEGFNLATVALDRKMRKDKCGECVHNHKSKVDKDSQIEHFESK